MASRHAGARWGHVGLTAHRGDPRHTLAHGLSRMVNHRTLVRSIADQHPVYPHLERLDDRLFHHRDSHHRSEGKVDLVAQNGQCLLFWCTYWLANSLSRRLPASRIPTFANTSTSVAICSGNISNLSNAYAVKCRSRSACKRGDSRPR